MNFMSYRNKEADHLLEKARKTYDSEKRKELYKKFQHIVVNDSPYLFLWSPKGIMAVNKRVKHFTHPNAAAGMFIHPERISM